MVMLDKPTALFPAVDFLGIDLAKSILKKPLCERPLWATSLEEVTSAVDDFCLYFNLVLQNPGEKLVPTVKQDEVWHAFMLHPVAYYNACVRHCGHLVNHDGGFGLEDNEKAALEEYKHFTIHLWEAVYGFPHPADPRVVGRACCSTCAPKLQ